VEIVGAAAGTCHACVAGKRPHTDHTNCKHPSTAAALPAAVFLLALRNHVTYSRVDKVDL
jgi:hypothetical protein